MRPSLYRSRNALSLGARRYQHHVSAQSKCSGLEAALNTAKIANGATAGKEEDRVGSAIDHTNISTQASSPANQLQ